MGIVEILTLIFIVLKLVGVIKWSWLLVLAPIIIFYGVILVFVTITLLFVGMSMILSFFGIARVGAMKIYWKK